VLAPVPPHVAAISIAPVKSLGLLHPHAVELTEAGVTANRAFHLIDHRGHLVNGKRLGPLVAVRPDWDPATGALALTFPDGSAVAGTVADGEPVSSWFFGRPRPSVLIEGPWSAALSEYAGTELRLARTAHTGAGTDRGRGGAMSLLSVAAAEQHDLDVRRFRMLFAIGGVPAHAEDEWVGHRVRVGDAVVRPTGHTGRCLVTSQNPDTGRPDTDVLDLLRRVRPADTAEPLPFGVHGVVVQPGTVRVGDPVEPHP
jgi:uncharacterized protein YcbX